LEHQASGMHLSPLFVPGLLVSRSLSNRATVVLMDSVQWRRER